MADVLLLALAALLTLGVLVTAMVISRAGRLRREVERRRRPARLRSELDGINDYIRRVDQATADDQLDRLEESRETRWDGSSSR